MARVVAVLLVLQSDTLAEREQELQLNIPFLRFSRQLEEGTLAGCRDLNKVGAELALLPCVKHSFTPQRQTKVLPMLAQHSVASTLSCCICKYSPLLIPNSSL